VESSFCLKYLCGVNIDDEDDDEDDREQSDRDEAFLPMLLIIFANAAAFRLLTSFDVS